MTKITENHYEDHHRHVFPCDCGDSHFIDISWWDDEEDMGWPIYAEINETYCPHRVIDRIKYAFLMLRGKKHFHNGLILSEESIISLSDTFSAKLEEAKKYREDHPNN